MFFKKCTFLSLSLNFLSSSPSPPPLHLGISDSFPSFILVFFYSPGYHSLPLPSLPIFISPSYPLIAFHCLSLIRLHSILFWFSVSFPVIYCPCFPSLSPLCLPALYFVSSPSHPQLHLFKAFYLSLPSPHCSPSVLCLFCTSMGCQ